MPFESPGEVILASVHNAHAGQEFSLEARKWQRQVCDDKPARQGLGEGYDGLCLKRMQWLLL